MDKKNIIEKKEINFRGFNIQILKKKIKNINLTIRTDGTINLSVPFKLSEKEIYKFLQDKREWIEKNHSKFNKIISLEYKTGEVIEYLGIQYIINIIETYSKEKVELNGEYLDLFILRKNNNKDYLKAYIDNWYRKNLIFIVTDLTEIWADRLDLKVNEIKVRKLKRTWGSCNTKKKNITYSLELAKKDRRLIEYVVVHELSHLIHDNHGKEFKELLNKLMPDWKIRKKELNNMKVDKN